MIQSDCRFRQIGVTAVMPQGATQYTCNARGIRQSGTSNGVVIHYLTDSNRSNIEEREVFSIPAVSKSQVALSEIDKR